MNHACAFNAVCTYSPGGAVLNVRAVQDIEQGQPVCYAYIDPYQPRRTRRAQLRDAYFFDCLCPQCSPHGSTATPGADARMCALLCRAGAAACTGALYLPPGRLGVSVVSARAY